MAELAGVGHSQRLDSYRLPNFSRVRRPSARPVSHPLRSARVRTPPPCVPLVPKGNRTRASLRRPVHRHCRRLDQPLVSSLPIRAGSTGCVSRSQGTFPAPREASDRPLPSRPFRGKPRKSKTPPGLRLCPDRREKTRTPWRSEQRGVPPRGDGSA